ncbi:MAG: hypothetical protein LRY73_17970 [Bacillus sp. (in: Bacteria)]|nr:hypothetical protein [Bacillus sp. (in: firmicutes)]
MKKAISILIIFLVILAGCNNVNETQSANNIDEEQLTANEVIAKRYLEETGYTIVTIDGEHSWVVERESINEMPSTMYWVVQTVWPDKYFEKEIDSVYVIVNNHPLSPLADVGNVFVDVWLFNGEVIGGYSNHINATPMAGGVYTVHGLTAEELHGPEFFYPTWRDEWDEKYGY